MRLKDYFDKLQREHHPKHNPRRLIREWENSEVRTVKAAIKRAINSASYIGETMCGPNVTNQAIGNASEKFFIRQVNPHLSNAIESPKGCGRGYPDTVIKIGTKRYCMEFKATSSWDDNDSNRRVLTSSPDRLLKLIENEKVDNPPAHLVGTVLYDESTRTVTKFRVDFIGPETEINVRLEASTSQRLLANYSYKPLII